MTSTRAGFAAVLRLLCVFVVVVASPATVAADPGDPSDAPATPEASAAPGQPTTVIGWRQFGRSDTLELRGANVANNVDIPVPSGIIPTTVTGLIGGAVNVATGRVDILDRRGIALGSIPIPVAATTVPFNINTAGALVADGILTLNFVLRSSNPPVDICEPTPLVTLTQLATGLTGRPPSPTTVSNFLPGYLEKVVIRLGLNPGPDQQQAALTLSAILTRTYRPIPIRVDVDTSDNPTASDIVTTRTVAIRDSERAGIVVANAGTPRAVLVISGRGVELSRQLALFSDRRLTLTQTTSAAVISASEALTESSRAMTFEQLGIASSNSFTGTSTIYTGIDIADFGVGPVTGASVHMIARYTPTNDDAASLMVRSGPYVLATRRLDSSGLLDMPFDVPADVLTSEVNLALEIQYFPDSGKGSRCAPLNDRLTFALDPRSTVEVTPGSVRAGGFTMLPAAFTPDFDVSVEEPGQLRFAVQAVNLMGQRTGALLRPRLTSLEEGAKSRTGLLVVSSGGALAQAGIKPPLSATTKGLVEIDGTLATGAELGTAPGVVQAFIENGRMVLAIDAPTEALAQATFDYIRGQPNGWSSLSGDVLATGASGNTVALSVRNSAPPASASDRDVWKWALVATVTAAAIGLVAVIRARAVRKRRFQDAQ